MGFEFIIILTNLNFVSVCHPSLEVVCQLFNSSLIGIEFIMILTNLIFCFRQMLFENPRPWHIIWILVMASVLILKYSHKLDTFSKHFYLQPSSLPSPHYDWLRDRFSQEEKKKMSQVGRRIFLSEVNLFKLFF